MAQQKKIFHGYNIAALGISTFILVTLEFLIYSFSFVELEVCVSGACRMSGPYFNVGFFFGFTLIALLVTILFYYATTRAYYR